MSFNTAITGLKAASTMLDVTGNNIANVSTTGFKSSRTEFADIYATSVVGAGSSNTPGSGVTVSGISQDFSAGTIEFTNNNLDLAINGSGFFQLSDGQGSTTYSRAGAFELNKDGQIVSKTGKFLQGYGLDDAGNRLPIGNLEVSQKESPPKATESIDLSFNIDARADSSKLLPNYDKDEPGSFTYTTTVRTFDSLGNEHTIKYNFAEQRPVREVYNFDIASTFTPTQYNDGVNTYDIYQDSSGNFAAELDGLLYSYTPTGPVVGATVIGIDTSQRDDIFPNTNIGGGNIFTVYQFGTNFFADNGTSIVNFTPTNATNFIAGTDTTGTISGSALSNISSFTQQGTTVVDPVAVVISGVTIDNPNSITQPERESLAAADPRIDVNSIGIVNGKLNFELLARSTNEGEVSVVQAGARLARTDLDDIYRPANEVRTYSISNLMANPEDLVANINIGGVNINLSGLDDSRIATAIQGREAEILDRNPAIEQVNIEQIGTDYRISITFKADEGDIRVDAFRPELTVENGQLSFGSTTFDSSGINSGTTEPDIIVQGDNSYRGFYRTYAYFNGEEILDLGKLIDPGFPGGGEETEKGPIILQFDPTNGLLRSVNGDIVPAGGQAPAITIKGADPADPTTLVTLRLDNSTQFASASIVKNQQQDGYTKGDLIGVTFAPTGEMVASFSNGQNQSLGVVAFATFENQDGLQPSGDTEWIATLESGNAILNPPGTGLNGTLRSAALEQSNVDLSTELVNLIQAQRNFQASSKTLETANNITQNILNI